MHAYATDAKDRESVPVWLAIIAIALTLAFNSISRMFSVEVPWWLSAPSVMGFYGLLYQLFNRVLWFRTFGNISFSSIPNLQGSWMGTINSNYEGEGISDTLEAIMYIHQTWSAVNIRLETETSDSFSIMAAINTQKSAEPSMKYEYMNEPSALSIQTMQTHRGTASLKLSADGVMLKGDYFTGRGRQSLGCMEFKLLSREYLTSQQVADRIIVEAT